MSIGTPRFPTLPILVSLIRLCVLRYRKDYVSWTLCIRLGHLWTLAAGGDKAREYSACGFSAFMYTYISSTSALPISPSALHPARRRFTLKSQGPLSTIASIFPSRLTETTTQLTRLLSAPARSLTSILPVTERQLPTYSLTWRHIRYHSALRLQNKETESSKQQITTLSTTCRRHVIAAAL